MAASLPRPDPTSPASVAEASFTTTRRGYQPDEVRAFLASVAVELGRLQERERQLEAELRSARLDSPADPQLDDDTVAKLLGEETLRVLQTARESASQIKIRAEESAARIFREAGDEANRLRQDAEIEAARKRQDAASDAEAEVALAKQQGREMVNEARSYRERVLADLERRTTLARKQIEELLHGRDRLLQVFERARLVAVDVTTELRSVEGPEELVNFSPTTGPVPLMVPAGRLPQTEQPAEEDAEPADAVADEVAVVDEAQVEEPAVATEQVGDAIAEGATTDASEEVLGEDGEVRAGSGEPAASGEPATARNDNVVSLFRGRDVPEGEAADAHAVDEHDADGSAADKHDVDGIFARLRSEATEATEATESEVAADVAADVAVESVEASEPADAAGEPASTPFTRRDESIVPLIVSAARKLKRVLADEQNGVLDTLRRKEAVLSIDALLPALGDHAGQYTNVIHDELLAAAAAGAAELGASDTATLRRRLAKAGALESASALVRADLISPLRDRLERSVADGGGDNDDITKRVRAVYREWKTQHIDDLLDDVFRFAHGAGLSITVEPGTPMVWAIDPGQPACPDCEDNSLAGPVPAGEPYPTGHASAPAHPGCRCLTVPAGQ